MIQNTSSSKLKVKSSKLDEQTDSSENTASSGAKSMADLMAKHKTSFSTFRKGDAVSGKITKLTKNEILVDINAKSAAVVLEKDKTILRTLLEKLHVGDEVEVQILNPESDWGNPVVSLRRFLSNSSWKQLEEAQKVEGLINVTVTDLTKGGILVTAENGLSGFLPNSHLGSGNQPTTGKQIKVRVIEINRKDNKIIFSQKQTISAQLFNEAIKSFKIGDSIDVNVLNIAPFGVFTFIPIPGKTRPEGGELQLDGLIHISEISWDKVDEITNLYAAGDKITAKIIGFDKNTRRIDLSLKQLTPDPFDNIANHYPLDKNVSVAITKIDDSGVYINLGAGIEGIIRKDKIPPTMNFKIDQTILATVSEIDKKRHKIYLVPVLREKPIGYR
jgi:small subunit ribosomal protein S1